MPRSILILGSALAVTVALASFGVMQFRLARELATELDAVKKRQEEAAVRATALEDRLRLTSRRADAAEGDNATLLVAINQTQAAKVPALAPPRPQPTPDEVRSRYDRARELARTGDPAEALGELLWCFDEGMAGIASFRGVRLSYLLSTLHELGQRHLPALAALRERRDAAQQRILSAATSGTEIPDLVAINRTLAEDHRTLALFDQLPTGDRRRPTMAIYASELLLEHRRYQDVLAARPYATMSSQFEVSTQERTLPANLPDPARTRTLQRESAIKATLNNIEVLAGAGDIIHARMLAERLLAYDNTENTRTLLQQQATRAGRPDLLSTPAP
jgi:hypothetical protein